MLKNKYQISNIKYQNEKPEFKIFNKFWILICNFDFCILIFAFYMVFGFWFSSFAQEQFVYDDKGKRNPFIPLVTSDGRIINLDKDESSEIRLEGIIYDERGFSCAIVNQAIVKIGDWVGNYRVLKVEKNKVIFLKEGQPIEVELKKEEE